MRISKKFVLGAWSLPAYVPSLRNLMQQRCTVKTIRARCGISSSKKKNFATPDCCGIQNAGQSFESASPCGVLQWVIGCAADFCLPAAKLSCGECRQRGACSIDGRWTDVCTMRDSQHWRPRPGVDTAAHSCRLPTALTRSTVPVASAGGKMSAALVRADIVRASLRTDHARAIELDLTDHHSRIHKR